MPHESRVSGNFPERSNKELERSGVGCAAGQAHVGTPCFKPISAEHRSCLTRLVEIGRMIRRIDGSYGTDSEMMMPNAIAVDLKNRRFAAAGFDKCIVPTERGLKLLREKNNAP